MKKNYFDIRFVLNTVRRKLKQKVQCWFWFHDSVVVLMLPRKPKEQHELSMLR